jgi:hypothetical protein
VASKITSSSVVYSDVVVNGTAVNAYAAICSSWNQFYSGTVTAGVSKQLVRLTLAETFSLNVSAATNKMFECRQTSSLLTLQSASVNGSTVSIRCGSNTWTVGSWSGNFAVCVNCTAVSTPTSYSNSFDPCSSSGSSSNSLVQSESFSERYASFARVLIATFAVVVPTVKGIIGSTVTTNSGEVSVAVDQSGAVYCSAFPLSVTPTAAQQIVSGGFSGWTVNNAVNVTITSLEAATDYYVYCIAMSARGQFSDVVSAIAGRLLIKTSCCRSISFGLISKSVYADKSNSKLATLAVSVLPSAAITVKFSTVLSNSTGTYTASIVFPKSLTISATSAKVFAVAFVGASYTGTYNISVILSGDAAADYETVFPNGFKLLTLNRLSTPSTPFLQKAQFSSDGASVGVTFDSSTDKGQLSSVNNFVCSQLLVFTGASFAKCQWSTDATAITITPSVAYPLSVGSQLSAVTDKIRASCPIAFNSSVCSKWVAVSSSKILLISAPSSPTTPKIQITLPSAIGSCDSLVMDFGSSTGSGGRAWSSANISLSSTKASNITGLTAYLTQFTSAVATRLMIPGGYLSKGYQYSFTVSLCNFLGACGTATAGVSVLNLAVPTVTVSGGPVFSVFVNSSITLSSHAYTASCDGSQSTLNLQYSWAIYLLNGSSTSGLSLVSVSRDPSKYSLRAYQLSPQCLYSVQVTVTNLVSLKSSSTAVTVTVPASDLIVLIAGGGQQSVRATHSFTVDASSSYDCDQTGKGRVGIDFSWSCYKTSPAYSSLCPLTLGLANTSVLSGFANISAVNTTALVSVSMYDTTRVASLAISINVLLEAAPLVHIVTVLPNSVQSSSILVLQGSVSLLTSAAASGSSLECVWTVDDASVDLIASSYVPPAQSIAVTSKSLTTGVYLSLAANSLSVGASFTFTLSCVLVDAVTGSLSSASYASVDVSTNSPPTPGTYTVSPMSGIELLTTFEMSARYWVDIDIPISYEFGFTSAATGETFVVQTKGLNAIATAFLAAGSASANYSLATSTQVFDSLGASTTKYVTVRVLSTSLNSTNINSKTLALLTQVGTRVDGMKQVISIVASTLTSVNCSLAPNCTELNRFSCGSTAQTCGACLSDEFIGARGDSNSKCILVADYESVPAADDSSCESDSDCSAWSECDIESNTCRSVNKNCIANCTGVDNGECVFVHVSTLNIVESCAVDDPECDAVCVCYKGFYGDDCAFAELELLALQDTTMQLMTSLQSVNNLETLDSQSAVFWSNSLRALTASSYLLTDAAAAIAYNISMTMLQDTASTASPAVTSTLGAVVDNILGSSYLSTSTLSFRRRLATNSVANASAISAMLDTLSSAVVGAMVPGQDSQTIVQSNYRLVGSIISSSIAASNFSVSAPQTALEAATNLSYSSLQLVNVANIFGESTSLDVGVGVMSVPPYLLDLDSYSTSSSSTVGNLSAVSNAFRLNLHSESAVTTSSCNDSAVVLMFVHYQSESFGVIANSTGGATSITTACEQGVNRTVLVSCPSFSQQFPVYCNGSLPSHSVVTRCPQQQRLPACAMTTYNGSQVRCDVVNYTDTQTTCRCSSCLFMDFGSGRRRLESVSASTYGTEILALSEYSFTEYASVMESAAAFNSLAAIKDTILIIITFAVIWLGTIVAVCALELARRYRVATKLKQNASKVSSVVPQGHNDASIVGSGSGRKASLTPINRESLQYTSLEECLKEYIYELFSPAFSDDSEPVRFMRELWNKHEYISVFVRKEFGVEQWIAMFCLLTNLNANFFLLALFYGIQFPSSDGTCELLDSEGSCVDE